MFRRLLNPGGQLSESKGLLHALTTSLDHGEYLTCKGEIDEIYFFEFLLTLRPRASRGIDAGGVLRHLPQ